MERGRIQGLPKFFEYPLLSQEWVKLRTSNLTGIFTGSMRTKALCDHVHNSICLKISSYVPDPQTIKITSAKCSCFGHLLHV